MATTNTALFTGQSSVAQTSSTFRLTGGSMSLQAIGDNANDWSITVEHSNFENNGWELLAGPFNSASTTNQLIFSSPKQYGRVVTNNGDVTYTIVASDYVVASSGGSVGTGAGLTNQELRATPVQTSDANRAELLDAIAAVADAVGTGGSGGGTVDTNGLTDQQLRATPVVVDAGQTAVVSAIQGLANALQSNALTNAQLRATPVPVDAGQEYTVLALQAITAALQATLQTNGITDTQLRATPVQVSSTQLSTAIQEVNTTLTNKQELTDTQLRATPVNVIEASAASILFAANSLITASDALKLTVDSISTLLTARMPALTASGSLPVTPSLSAGKDYVSTLATHTAYGAVTAESYPCKQITVINTSGTSIRVSVDGGTVGHLLYDGMILPLYGVTNASQVVWKREDATAVSTSITIRAEV